jgi:hypothetical protein
MTEGQQLDALTLDEAKGILHQIGYFETDTYFLSMQLEDIDVKLLDSAFLITKELPKDLLMRYCRDVVEFNERMSIESKRNS